MQELRIRSVTESDYLEIIRVVDSWWGGREVSAMLPRLFFIHFKPTSFVAELNDQVVGFTIGFISQTFPDEAYIHFSGVHPEYRKQGIGERLYHQLFENVRRVGCVRVRCITSPVNKGSIAFHQRMGFKIEPGDKIVDGISVTNNYDGRNGDRVLFLKQLT